MDVNRWGYSPTEVAELFGITRAHVYNLIARGELHSIKLGRSRRITHDSLMALVEGKGQQTSRVS
jgi:excisionase family DNA binding protein